MGAEAKQIALDVQGWMWGTVQGAFNEKMNVSQIVVDAVIGMIPFVGDVTAVRDLLAISLSLASDDKKREDAMQWVLLVVFIFALIPVIGGVIKGVARLAIKANADVAKDSKALIEIGDGILLFLNRVGHGNQLKWFKALDVSKYQTELLQKFHGFMDTVIDTLGKIKAKMGGVLPADFVAQINRWLAGLTEVKKSGNKMIPNALKQLHVQLHQLQQLVYRGEWSTVTGGAKNATREAEARLIEDSQVAAHASAHGGLKANKAIRGVNKVEIDKVYQARSDYADLLRGEKIDPFDVKKVTYSNIAAFSGHINPSKLGAGEHMLRVHIPGNAMSGWWIRLPKGVNETNWREFLKDGKPWRELWAVLDEFSKNGAFSIARVKPGQEIKAWEGKVAEQFGEANPGQYLAGGQTQLFVNIWDKAVENALDFVVKEGKTQWTDLERVGYAAGNIKVAGAARVERLTETEVQSKKPPPKQQTAGAH